MKGIVIAIAIVAGFSLLVKSCNYSSMRDSIRPRWTQEITMKCPTRTETFNAILNGQGKAIYYSVKETGFNYTRGGFETNYFNCMQIHATDPQRLNEVTAKRYEYMARAEYPEGI